MGLGVRWRAVLLVCPGVLETFEDGELLLLLWACWSFARRTDWSVDGIRPLGLSPMIARDVVLLYFSFLFFCYTLFLVGGLEMHFSLRHDTHHCFFLSLIFTFAAFRASISSIEFVLFYILPTSIISLA